MDGAFYDYGDNLPFNLEAEQSVLGSILVDPEILTTVMEKIKSPTVFYTDQHKTLYSLMLEMFSVSKPIDFITLLEEAKKESLFDSDEAGKAYLLHLMEMVPTTANVGWYCDILVEKFYLRNLLSATTEIAEAVRENEGTASQLLDVAEQKIYDIRQGRQVSELTPIADVVIGVYDNIYKVQTRTDSRYTGLPSGFTDLDAVISGLNKTDLILVAARPGMGKSAFALNVAFNVAVKNDVDVAIFSLEMSNAQVVTRMLSSDSLIENEKLRTGHLSTDEWTRLAVSARRVSGTHIYLDDTAGMTVQQMKAKLRRLKNLGLVVIDYLQLMQGGGRNENRVLEISNITRNLKIMAKELNVPVICLSQLSRTAERREGHRPMLSDLRDSGSIEQDADIVLFLFREAYYKDEPKDSKNKEEAPPPNPNIATLIVAKNRHGSTCDITIGWQGEYTRFGNAELRRNEP